MSFLALSPNDLPEGSDTSKNRVRDFEITLISGDFTEITLIIIIIINALQCTHMTGYKN